MAHARVILLWHMHQPLYVLPGENKALMPWVRLHCVKGYSDMISVIDSVPEMRAVFNFTPVLLQQIEDLVSGKLTDSWLELSRKNAAELELGEKLMLLEHFFKAHWENMIRIYPRYGRLLEQRGAFFDRSRFERNPSLFSTRDYRDLQVWFNLAWCGHAMFKKNPLLPLLVSKGENFTEEEKHALLDLHLDCMRSVLDDYRKAEAAGRIETSTTPYFHPILPLLIDTDLALRRMPGRALPQRFTAAEDAGWHVKTAVLTHEKFFGHKPRTMWPAEGSVAPEIIPILADAGIDVMFTDEGNLFHALIGKNAVPGIDPEHLALFQAWQVHAFDRQVTTFFRERALSDFIGFNAARNTPEKSAEYVLNKLAEIAANANTSDPVITLALDGENAWEAFPDGGERFLRLLYQGLVAHPHLEPTLPHQYLAQHAPRAHLSGINTGSWINSDFDIWIGDAEENTAWNLLGQTRSLLLAEQAKLDPRKREEAWLSLYAAEGSDWFWWFGPDFTTDSQPLFDELFRAHLARIYMLLERPVPLALSQPIRRNNRSALHKNPRARIFPQINGRENSYFEYIGAGKYDPSTQATAMYQSGRSLRYLWFGNSDTQFVVRLDWSQDFSGKLLLDLILKTGREITVTVKLPPAPSRVNQAIVDCEANAQPVAVECANDQLLELALPLQALGLLPGEELAFRVRLCDENGIEYERHPEAGFLNTRLTDAAYEALDWQA